MEAGTLAGRVTKLFINVAVVVFGIDGGKEFDVWGQDLFQQAGKEGRWGCSVALHWARQGSSWER